MLITRPRVLPTALVALLVVAGSLTPPLAESAPVPNLFVASNSNNSVVEYDGTTGALVTAFIPGGFPTGSGGLANPIGLAFRQDGNLLVTNGPYSSVLEYNGHTGAFLGAFVPSGSGGLFEPGGIVFGPNGNLFVASQGTQSVLEYDGHTGAFITTFVPSGSGGLAESSAPMATST